MLKVPNDYMLNYFKDLINYNERLLVLNKVKFNILNKKKK